MWLHDPWFYCEQRGNSGLGLQILAPLESGARYGLLYFVMFLYLWWLGFLLHEYLNGLVLSLSCLPPCLVPAPFSGSCEFLVLSSLLSSWRPLICVLGNSYFSRKHCRKPDFNIKHTLIVICCESQIMNYSGWVTLTRCLFVLFSLLGHVVKDLELTQPQTHLAPSDPHVWWHLHRWATAKVTKPWQHIWVIYQRSGVAPPSGTQIPACDRKVVTQVHWEKWKNVNNMRYYMWE